MREYTIKVTENQLKWAFSRYYRYRMFLKYLKFRKFIYICIDKCIYK